MNAQALEQTTVTPTLCATTLKDPMSVAVLVVIRVMEETAQVNFILIMLVLLLCYSVLVFSKKLEAQFLSRALEL